MATFDLWLNDLEGSRLANLNAYKKCTYIRTVNGVGVLQLTLPGSFDMRQIKADSTIEVWRSAHQGTASLDTETVWFVRQVERDLTNGEETILVEAESAATLLTRRIVAYQSSSGNAYYKNVAADTVLQNIWTANFGSGASGTRNIGIGVDGSSGNGPLVSIQCSYQPVLKVMQDVCLAASELGTRVYFDVIQTSPGVLSFRTYTGQRGTDHSSSGESTVIFAPSLGNMAKAKRSFDYRKEWTSVYAGGPGKGSYRLIGSAQDTARSNRSQYGLIERFINGTASSGGGGDVDTDILATQANTDLWRGLPRKRFTATLQDTPAVIRGVQWNFGDVVTVVFGNEVLDYRIESLKVILENGTETMEVLLQAEDMING